MSMMDRIVRESYADVRAGKFNTVATRRLAKSLVAYGVGMYISSELAKAGYRQASSVAQNMAETINGIVALFSEGDLVKMFTENPTLSLFKEVSNTIQNAAAYINVPGARKAKGRGVEDTYIAAIQTGKDVAEAITEL